MLKENMRAHIDDYVSVDRCPQVVGLDYFHVREIAERFYGRVNCGFVFSVRAGIKKGGVYGGGLHSEIKYVFPSQVLQPTASPHR